MKKLRVTVEGKVYDVLVELLDEGSPTPAPSPAPMPIAAAASAAAPGNPVSVNALLATAPLISAGPDDVKSPLAGRVVSVDVQAGQSVTEGTQVLTIEAMKMNTYIYAHKGGRIDAIHIAAGDAVEEGAVLLRIT